MRYRSRFTWGLLLCCCLSSTVGADTAQPPHIVLILVDDLGKDGIGCYGSADFRTPHIDALAARGMKFHRAWSMPQCTPTRATLLTGQYPWRTGWVNHWDVPRWGRAYFDPQRYTTFAEVLRQASYRTVIAGKWQINDFRVMPDALDRHGFDDWCVWTGYETGNPPSGKRYWDPYIHTREGSRTYTDRFGPDIYCDFLIDFFARHRDEPTLLYFPLALTHGPLVDPPPLPGETNHRGRKLSGRERLRRMAEYMDHLVGRLVAAVEEDSSERQAVIIFTTDNGTERGLMGTIHGQPRPGGKGSLYEAGICQPFIVKAPGLVPEGTETDALTDFTDLFSTMVDLAGGELPENITLDGHSLLPVLRGESKDGPREWILAMGYGPARFDGEGVRGRDDFTDRALRDRRYKTWVDTQRRVSALYDLTQDPAEEHNLLGNLSPEAASALEFFQELVDNMPAQDARPSYRPRDPLPWDRE